MQVHIIYIMIYVVIHAFVFFVRRACASPLDSDVDVFHFLRRRRRLRLNGGQNIIKYLLFRSSCSVRVYKSEGSLNQWKTLYWHPYPIFHNLKIKKRKCLICFTLKGSKHALCIKKLRDVHYTYIICIEKFQLFATICFKI